MIKDICVLVFLGWIGDWLKKIIQRKLLRFTYWRKGWDKTKIKPDFEHTVYVNDEDFRDENNNMNKNNKIVERFETYCKRVAMKIFNVSFGEVKNNETEKRLMVRRILDAVTHSLYDSGLWFDIDEDNGDESATTKDEAKVEPDGCCCCCCKMICCCRCCEIIDDGENTQDNTQKNPRPKCRLTFEDTKSRFGLQKIVDVEITNRATALIVYASSRSARVRMAASLSSFPSSVNLAFYIASVLFMFALTLLSVFENRSVIQRMSGFTCDSSASTNSSSVDFQSSSEAKSTWMLLGFRLVDSSSLAMSRRLLLLKS